MTVTVQHLASHWSCNRAENRDFFFKTFCCFFLIFVFKTIAPSGGVRLGGGAELRLIREGAIESNFTAIRRKVRCLPLSWPVVRALWRGAVRLAFML